MKKTCILSPDRQLTEEEQSLVWKKPPSHIESEAEKRIYEEIVRNWNRGEMKISTILLEDEDPVLGPSAIGDDRRNGFQPGCRGGIPQQRTGCRKDAFRI